MALYPSRKHYILLQHRELISPQSSIRPQKQTTPSQKPKASQAEQHAVNEVQKEEMQWCNNIKLVCAWKDLLKVTTQIFTSNLLPVVPIKLLQKSHPFIGIHHKFHRFKKMCCKNRNSNLKCQHTQQEVQILERLPCREITRYMVVLD